MNLQDFEYVLYDIIKESFFDCNFLFLFCLGLVYFIITFPYHFIKNLIFRSK